MKKILFLDDDILRHKKFQAFVLSKGLNKDYEFYYVFTTKDAIKLLNEFRFDAMHLDHDLGGKTFVTDIEETGYEVTLWMEQYLRFTPPDYIVLHSFNPDGAKRMAASLKKFKETYVIHLPFNY